MLTTELSNKDARGRIIIDVVGLNGILANVSNFKDYVDDFVYLSDDYKFVDTLPSLTVLHHVFKNQNIKSLPDLTPLNKIKSIGPDFAHGCMKLESIIDLNHLTNLESIGNGFAYGCANIENIDLSNLTKLESIGENFASWCLKLKRINMSSLANLKSIDTSFATNHQTCKIKKGFLINNSPINNIIIRIRRYTYQGQ